VQFITNIRWGLDNTISRCYDSRRRLKERDAAAQECAKDINNPTIWLTAFASRRLTA